MECHSCFSKRGEYFVGAVAVRDTDVLADGLRTNQFTVFPLLQALVFWRDDWLVDNVRTAAMHPTTTGTEAQHV